MKKELVKAADYGLEETKAKEISNLFMPMLQKMEALEKEYNEILKLPIDEKTCALANKLRLEYVKTRTGTAKIHKKLKSFYLQGGRFVDGWKNAQAMASNGIEEKLLSIAHHFINIEKAAIKKLQEDRSQTLSDLGESIIPGNLGEMPESIWDNLLKGAVATQKERKKEERKAERERKKLERQKKEEAKAKEEQIKELQKQNKILSEGLEKIKKNIKNEQPNPKPYSEGEELPKNIKIDMIIQDLIKIEEKYLLRNDPIKKIFTSAIASLENHKI